MAGLSAISHNLGMLRLDKNLWFALVLPFSLPRVSLALIISLKTSLRETIDFYEYRKKRILSEKDELPKLVQLCVDWARSSGRRSITVKDVEYFLHEINVHILEPTERELYLLVNNEMKN